MTTLIFKVTRQIANLTVDRSTDLFVAVLRDIRTISKAIFTLRESDIFLFICAATMYKWHIKILKNPHESDVTFLFTFTQCK